MVLSKVIVFVAVCISSSLAEPPSSYLPPSSYSTTNQHSFSPPSSTGFDSPSFSSVSTNYGAPPRPVYSAPKPTYSAPRPVYSAPKPVYSAPRPVYSAPAPVYTTPKPTYLPPAPAVSYAAPKPAYGLPQSNNYDNYNSEPAHYEYQYTVQDSHYGTDFGHKEGRQGDVTHGQYMVLLPDGRRQIVDYVADKNGYRPTIRYEGASITSIKTGY